MSMKHSEVLRAINYNKVYILDMVWEERIEYAFSLCMGMYCMAESQKLTKGK
jgi:hypothetical protein